MNIAPIRNQALFNISFKSRVVETKYGKVSPGLQDAIDSFEETNGSNATRIGEGLSSTAYKIKGRDCVVKVSKNSEAGRRNGDFSEEAKSLSLIPDGFRQAQRLIGNVRTEKNNWYLLTTYVNGKVPNGVDFKWDKKSLGSALSAFAELDAAHVYHGDLARSNCLVTDDGDVRLLDFQYSDKFGIETEKDHKENAAKYKVPYFIVPSNAQMFEGANFATYLTFLGETEAKNTFADYIREKSNYHKARAAAFKQEGARDEIIEYETLMAKYLKNPTKEIIDLCARKMEILLLHRYTTSSVEGFYSKLGAPSYYLDLIEKSDKMAQTAYLLSENTSDPELKKFYEYQMKDAEFWRDSMVNEVDGRYDKPSVFRWVLYEAETGAPKTRDDAKNSDFRKLPEIRRIVTGGKAELGIKPFDEEDEVSFWLKSKANDLRKTSSFYCTKNTREYEDINNYFEFKRGIINKLNCAHDAYLEDKNPICLFYGLDAFSDMEELRKKAAKLAKQPYIKDYNKQKMAEEAEFLAEDKDNMCEMNEWMYGRLLKHAYADDPQN